MKEEERLLPFLPGMLFTSGRALPAWPPEQPEPSKPVSADRPEPSGDALFGPQADRSPMVSRSVQEEAMLFYEDDDDEETGND